MLTLSADHWSRTIASLPADVDLADLPPGHDYARVCAAYEAAHASLLAVPGIGVYVHGCWVSPCAPTDDEPNARWMARGINARTGREVAHYYEEIGEAVDHIGVTRPVPLGTA